MTNALIQEIALRKDFLQKSVQTIYFGGGTPSLLPIAAIHQLIAAIRLQFSVSSDAEITLEANPDDITPEQLNAWKAAGINRLSIGIQSFDEADLAWMNRAHSAAQAHQAIQLAQAAGFENITIDLIYGSPALTDDAWMANLKQVIQYGIPHVSAYALTVEPKTALAHSIQQGKLPEPDSDKAAHHFSLLVDTLTQAGFDQYEISNFGKPNYYSRHNQSYWQGIPYLGIGPSAHSYSGTSRSWNVANNALYIKAIQQQQLPFEEELLTKVMQFNEYIMTGLRTAAGISLSKLVNQYGESIINRLQLEMQPYINEGMAATNGNAIWLTPKGRFLADGIAARLFLSEGDI